MPSPATTEEFLDLVQKSAVVEDKRLAAYLERVRAGGGLPQDPRDAAAWFVRDGLLTHFQAEQILQGKWKRFSIGKYKVLERLGAGGMGSVYLCEHKLMRRRVAVKVLPTAKAEDPSSLERFYREARAVAALDHPNIVRAYDIDQDDKLHFLVMEHVDGANLQEIVKRNGPLSPLRACHYMRQAALGLQHAHDAAGIVHRDIKPGNILVDRNGIVKILDMGLARFFYDEEDILTKKYDENVLGTADYLAPEQATDSHTVDIRADIYSLGATFYFCLTGRTPFQEGTVAQKLIWHQTRQPKPLRTFRDDVPEGVAAILDRTMAKDPAQRYQSPREVAEALSPWTETPIPPPPEIEMPRLSLAAMGGESSMAASTNRPPAAEDASPSPRKSWQVPRTPTPGSLPRPVTAPLPPPVVVASPPPRRSAPPPAPPARPAPAPPRPQAAANGLIRPSALAAKAEPAVSVAEPPPWEQPAMGVQSRHADEADSGVHLEPPSRKTPPRAPLLAALTARPWLIVAAVAALGVGAAAVLGIVLVWALSRPTPTTQPERPPLVYQRLNDKGEKVRFEALLRTALPRDRILVKDDIETGCLTTEIKRLTIEAEPGKTIVWKYTGNGTDGSTLLTVNNADGFVLKGITLDGGGKVDQLVNVYGRCPGLTLQDLRFKNFKKYGIHFTNCEGSRDQYVTLRNLSFETDKKEQAALYFSVVASHKTIKANQFFRIHDCKLIGNGERAKFEAGTLVDYLDAPQDWRPMANAR